MNTLITLCARGGSKGIPNKNIKLLNGKPLLSYSIDIAQQFSKLFPTDIVISTDAKDILNVAKEYGITTDYIRPAHLANDTAGKLDSIVDVLIYEEAKKGYKYDVVLDLDVSSPLRTLNDLKDAYEMLLKDSKAINLFSVNNANRNPYFNMVEQQNNGYYNLVKKGKFLTRQSCPKLYDLNASFYFYKRDFFTSSDLNVMSDFALIYEMKHICFDLDHLIDFDFMEYLILNNKLDFKF